MALFRSSPPHPKSWQPLFFTDVLITFYWSITALQCCVCFYCIVKWISFMYTYIPLFWDFLPISVTTEHTPVFTALLFTIARTWVQSLNRVRLFMTPWTVAHQAPLSMGFSRQEYWSGLPFPKHSSTEEWAKKMWYIYTKDHHPATKKELNWVMCKDVVGPRDRPTEWSQKGRATPLNKKTS